jgi:hypothetical protein
MREWREAQRQKAGGMVQLTVWVPARAFAYLKIIFGRLADPSDRGEDYRLAASAWLYRRRVPAARFEGADFAAEIDMPRLGPPWHTRPAGGRVIDEIKTWIELTPDEADEIDRLCRKSVTNALARWLSNRDLAGKRHDHTGAALGLEFCAPGYQSKFNESIIRPVDDAAFAANEAKIARDVDRAAQQSRRHSTDDPTIVEYEGIHRTPSRCHAVHRRVGDRILFALGYIEHGGTSPTNAIATLTEDMWKRFYPDDRFDRIEWYDCRSPGDSLTGQFQMRRVVFPDVKGGPIWGPADDVPADFMAEVLRAISRCLRQCP